MKLDCTQGRRISFPVRSDGMRIYLEDKRTDADAGSPALHSLRLRVSAPYAGGEYRRTFRLAEGQQAYLDTRHLEAMEITILEVDGCADGRQLYLENEDAPPETAQRMVDVVVYANVAPSGANLRYYTPPDGAVRWMRGELAGGGVSPVPGTWHLGSGHTLIAGGSAGTIDGPSFTFDKAGTDAVIAWEVAL
jgi:hypothetical protein